MEQVVSSQPLTITAKSVNTKTGKLVHYVNKLGTILLTASLQHDRRCQYL